MIDDYHPHSVTTRFSIMCTHWRPQESHPRFSKNSQVNGKNVPSYQLTDFFNGA